MAGLTRAQEAAIDQLIAASPDVLLSRLESVLARTDGERVRVVRARIAEEAADRRVRTAVYGPAAALAGRGGDVTGPRFPTVLFAAAWRAAIKREPHLAKQAARYDAPPAVLDRMVLTLTGILRDEADGIVPGLDPQTSMELARFLDFVPLTRPIAERLPGWVQRMDEDDGARLRLCVNDATAIGPDGALRVLEMLAANLAEPAMALRLVGHASLAGGSEHLLAGSDLAVFGERVIATIQGATERFEALHVSAVVRADMDIVARDLDRCAVLITELSTSIEMCEHGQWSRRLHDLNRRLNRKLSEMYAACEKAVDKVAPLERTKMAGRMTRLAPSLEWPADPVAIERALALAALLGLTRTSAAAFGCSSLRQKTIEALGARLTPYVDEALAMLNDDEAVDPPNARRLIALAIDLLQQAGETNTAGALRRRLSLVRATPSQAVG